MLIKILGILDVISVLMLIFASWLPQKLIIVMAVYLIIKGIYFSLMGGFFPNAIDSLVGFYLIVASAGISHWIPTVLIIIFMLQKALVSIFS